MHVIFQTRHVLFDGGCGLCRKTLRILSWLDWIHKTIAYDVAGDWPTVHERFPQLQQENCLRDMHVVTSNNQTYRGFDAYRSLAWIVPLAWPILPLLYLPPIRWLGWRIYRRVADNRRTCSIQNIHR